MIKGLKCISCGGALEPAEGASICKCEKCGTVQPVPAQIPEEKAVEETPETAYLEACAMEEAAADSAALAAAAEAFDKAGNWRDAAERAADCRRKAKAAKEAEKAASFQRWLKERGEREKAGREEAQQFSEKQPEPEKGARKIKTFHGFQPGVGTTAVPFGAQAPTPSTGNGTPSGQVETSSPRVARVRRQERSSAAGRRGKQEAQKKKIFIAVAVVLALALVAVGGYLAAEKLRKPDSGTGTPQTAAEAPRTEAPAAPADTREENVRAEETLPGKPAGTEAPQDDPEKTYLEAEQNLADGNLAEARRLFLLAGDYRDSARQTELIDGYETAMNHWRYGEKLRAEQELEALGDWHDAPGKLTALRTEIADDAVANRDYDTALAYYEKLPYSDETNQKITAAKQARDYQAALAALAARNLEEARRNLISAGGYLDSDAKLEELDRYLQAKDALDAGRFEEARALFAGLGDYLDAAEGIAACDAALSVQAGTAEAAPEPAAEPDAAPGTDVKADAEPETKPETAPEPDVKADAEPETKPDTGADAQKEAEYRAALAHLDQGEYAEAEAMLSVLSGWKDADEKLDRLREELADRAAEAGDYQTAVSYYNQVKSRSDSFIEKLIAANEGLNYQEGMAALEAGDSDTAYAKLLAAGEHPGAEEMRGRLEAYRMGAEAMADGRYLDARMYFARLGDYYDAEKRLEECSAILYQQAADMRQAGDNAGAYELFAQLAGYADSAEIARGMDADYREAAAAEESGDRIRAEALLAGLAGWRDMDERLETLRTEIAGEAAEAGDYDTALTYYGKLRNPDGEKIAYATRGKNYQAGMAALAAGNLDTAAEKLTASDGFQDAAEQLEKLAAYRSAGEEMAGGRFREARTEYIRLGSFLDSEKQLEECNAALYREAAEKKRTGDNAGAYELFSLLSGYSDSGEIAAGMDADYQAAADAAESGDPVRAEALLEGFAGWRDTDERLENLREQIADTAAEAGDYDTAIAYYRKLKNSTDENRDKLTRAEQGRSYGEGLAALKAGDLETARARFAGAGDFGDAAEQIRRMDAYLAAGELEAQSAPDEAIRAYAALGDYLDSAERISAIRYEKAKALRENGDLQAAQAAFAELGDYSDAADMARKLEDELADGYIAAGNYGAALDMYLEAEQTDEIREKIYALAQRCYDGEAFAEAVRAYEALGRYEMSLSRLPIARYAWADQLFTAGEYEKAAAQFSLLGDMSDSRNRVKDCTYELARGCMEEGRYDEGKALFAEISGYRDADEQALACDYRKAASLAADEKFQEAQALFESLEDYSDSREQADMCVYMRAEELLRAERYGEAMKLYGSVQVLDSTEKYNQCAYMTAEGHYADGRFREAEEYFRALGDYRDSAERARDAHRQYGRALAEAGSYEQALAILEEEDDEDSRRLAEQCRYEMGYEAMSAGNRDEAVQLYARAMNIPETALAVMAVARDYAAVKETDKAVQALWLIRDRAEAKSYLEEIAAGERQAGTPVPALLAYMTAGDTDLPEARVLAGEVTVETFVSYARGCGLLPETEQFAAGNICAFGETLLGAGMYREALAAFEEAGDYHGAAERTKEARYRLAESLYEAGDYPGALEMFRQVKGYGDTDERLATDPELVRVRTEPYIRVGNIVTFGHYEQDNDLSNGEEPIEWIVLQSQNGKSLLLSRYGLDAQPYHSRNTKITWEKSSLRAWLNSDFLQAAFTEEEQKAISPRNLDNSRKQGYWKTDGGKNTLDQVFLLSCAEAQNYLGVTYRNAKNEKARTSPTAYAAARGAEMSASGEDGEQGNGLWWLRSPGLNEQSAAFVHNGGSLYYRSVGSLTIMVRPAVVIDLGSDVF